MCMCAEPSEADATVAAVQEGLFLIAALPVNATDFLCTVCTDPMIVISRGDQRRSAAQLLRMPADYYTRVLQQRAPALPFLPAPPEEAAAAHAVPVAAAAAAQPAAPAGGVLGAPAGAAAAAPAAAHVADAVPDGPLEQAPHAQEQAGMAQSPASCAAGGSSLMHLLHGSDSDEESVLSSDDA